jgi:aspartyl-tRNA(Asn)/glutamyl-tRNA(Gln) amidotransferase subunit C
MIARGFFLLPVIIRTSPEPCRSPAFRPTRFEDFVSMTLTVKDVQNIAHLARLEVTPAELPVYAASLGNILGLVEQLNEADTSAVEPMAHPLANQVQRLRDDSVDDTDRHEKYQRNAPCVEGGFYLVPTVID